MTDHAADRLIVLPVPGLPEFRPGDDLAQAIASAFPVLADGDVVVVTSKVVSKVEGQIVAAPADPGARDELRREWVLREARRVVARKGRTLITENRLGIIAAASGVDGSNVARDELVLLPRDPDVSARRLRADLHRITGRTVAVLITDTLGRAWRIGQTDVAIGAAGIAVTHPYAGSIDGQGNELAVTEVAVADEIAAAADLVKGKLGARPVAIVRGLRIDSSSSDASGAGGAVALLRGGEDDLFWLGAAEAIDQGRREALLLRRSVRSFTDAPVDPDMLNAALAEALTAPAPHHTRPVRLVWVRTPEVRTRLLDAMAQAWRADLAADGWSQERIERRIARGDILRNAPEIVIPCWTPDGAHDYPDERRQACEATMFTVAAGAAVQALLVALAVRGLGSCWIGSTIFAAGTARRELSLPDDWHPLGAVAIGHPCETLTPRAARPADHEVVMR